MRTWKWMLTASLLLGFSAMAQQTTAPASPSPAEMPPAQLEPGCIAEHSAAHDQHARAAGSDACRGRAHHHGPGGGPRH